MTFEYGSDRAAFWADYVDRVGYGIASYAAYDEFLEEEKQLGKLFGLWADSRQEPWVKHVAYTRFWEILRDKYGLKRDSFDWVRFREKYVPIE